jgi:hypothetical protein
MATKRVTPIDEDFAQAQNISINAAFQASPRACIILASQQITFTNASGSTVSITFVPNSVNPQQKIFGDIQSLQSGPSPSAPQTPNAPNGNGSVNYHINAGGKSYGPFGIQVGDGPLIVFLTLSGSNITCTPDPVAIPPYDSTLGIAGTIEFVPDNISNNYSIGWPGGDPFTPPITYPDSQPHGDGATTLPADYSYTVNTPNPKQGGSGAGTVKLKGS